MSGRTRSLGRSELAATALGQGSSALASIAAVSIFSRALDPASYGVLALGLTATQLAQLVAFGPLAMAAQRFVASASEVGEQPAAVGSLLRLMAVAAVTVSALLVAASFVVSRTMGADLAVALLAGTLLAVPAGVNAVALGTALSLRRRWTAALVQGLEPWARIAGGLAALELLGVSAGAALGGFVGGSLAVALGATALLLSLAGRDGGGWTGRMVAYAWPMAAWGLAYWAQSATDRWSLRVLAEPAEVGRYFALFQLGYLPMVLVGSAVNQLYAPVLYAAAGRDAEPDRRGEARRVARRAARLTLSLAAAATLVAAVAHGPVIAWLAPIASPSSHLLPVLVAGGGLFALGQTLSLDAHAGTHVRALLLPKISCAIAATAAVAAGAALGGAAGVAWAMAASSALFAAWMLLLWRPVATGAAA